MNWEAIGAIAEAMGAVGVIATLAYLSIQLRQNTNSVRAASAATHAQAASSLISLLAQDEDAGLLWDRGLQDPEALSDAERSRFERLMHLQMIYLQQSVELDHSGALSEDLRRTTTGNIAWMVRQPGFRAHHAVWGAGQPPRLRALFDQAILDCDNNGRFQGSSAATGSESDGTSAAAQQDASADSA
jgi:hypothetical protein